MKLQVFDTYAKLSDGKTNHIDILMPEGKSKEEAIKCGTTYLESKGLKDFTLTSEECSFCHIQSANEQQEKDVNENGYSIIQM